MTTKINDSDILELKKFRNKMRYTKLKAFVHLILRIFLKQRIFPRVSL